MHNHYIINGVVEFYPATGTLRRLDNHQDIVILHSPAGRCFLLLINRQGSIVTQEEFMEEVWNKCGIIVSSNTYYQNISILRKGLKKIGFDEEIVVTISRMGLTLADGLVIEKREAETLLSIDADTNLDIETALVSEEDEREEEPSLVRKKPRYNGFKNICSFSLPVLSCLLFFILIILFIYTGGAGSKNNYYEKHVLFYPDSQCKVFYYPWGISQELQQKLLKIAEDFSDECESFPYVYIDSYPFLPRISVVRCQKPIGQETTCISDYFIGRKN